MTLQELRVILLEAGIPVAHYKTQLTEYPYIIWRELSALYNFAGGKAWREITNVSVDHFTDEEWDASLDKLKIALLKNNIKFTTATIWYEDDEIIQTSFDLSISRELDIE